MATGYFGRHWRGELSLATSFWLNNVVLPIPAGLALGAWMAWMTVTGEGLRNGSIAILVAWPLLLLLSVWCIVGGWRAARAYRAEGGGLLWPLLAQLVLASSALSTAFSFAFGFVPHVDDYLRLARGIDPLGNLRATLSPDGARLRLEGPIGLGDAARVRALLDGRASQVRTLELDSPGGRLIEAERLAERVRAAGLHTRAVGPCESACTLLHMAGTRRQMLPGGKLGFHRASSGTVNPLLDALANQEMARIYREAGLPANMLRRVLATPAHSMWFPDRAELIAAGLLSVAERPLDVELPEVPAGSAPSRTDFSEALVASDTWLALEARFPGLLAEAAARMAAAQAQGADAAALQVEAQRVIQGRLPTLLAASSHAPREAYLALLTEQLTAARGLPDASVCQGVLAGDAAARRGLPVALVQREAGWLIDAAGEPARVMPVRPFSALEIEVLRRRLGEGAPARLRNLWRAGAGPVAPAAPTAALPPSAPSRNFAPCDRALELLRTVAALPAAERRLAARMLFERG